MKALKKWSEKIMKKMNLCDWALAKLVLVLLGIIIGAYIAWFVRNYIWYFAAVLVILYAVLIYKLLLRE